MGAGAGPPRPRIALLAQDAYVHKAGVARYQLELIRGLAPITDLNLLVYRKLLRALPPGPRPPEIERSHLHFYSAPRTVLRNAGRIAARLGGNLDLLDWQPEVALLNLSTRLFAGVYCDREGFALIHGTSSYLPRTRKPTARVVTMHDVTPITRPDLHTRTTKRAFLKAKELDAATEVLFDAAAPMDDFLAVMRHPSDHCHVVHLAVDHAVFNLGGPTGLAKPDAPLGAPYIISVGTIEPRKNLVRGLAAFEELVRRHPGLQWKIVGAQGWGWKEFVAALSRSPVRGQVEYLGSKSDAEVAELYRGARACWYPTLWEGFGLPVLEAMACGTPVAASDLPVLREIAGDHFVRLDPTSVPSMVEAVEAAIALRENPAAVAAACGRAREFTWPKTVEGTLAVYCKALNLSPDDLRPAAAASG